MIELIALVINAGNNVLLTTHSPYVLGAINNLLYADIVQQSSPERVEAIVPRSKWLCTEDCDATPVLCQTAVQTVVWTLNCSRSIIL